MKPERPDNVYDVSLGNLCGGAASERFHLALQHLIDNCQDVNTDYDAKRKITLEITAIPNKERTKINYEFKIVEKPAPLSSMFNVMYIQERNGKRSVIEQDLEQRTLFDDNEDVVKINNAKTK